MKLSARYFLAVLLLAASSCVSYKHVPYFQDLPQNAELSEDINNYKPILIQNNDVLSITVTSLNPEASAPFNPPPVTTQTQSNTLNNPVSTGFMVDQKG